MLPLPILSLMGWQENMFNSQQQLFSFDVAEPHACDVYLGLLHGPFLRGSQKSRFLSSNAGMQKYMWNTPPFWAWPLNFFFFLMCVNKNRQRWILQPATGKPLEMHEYQEPTILLQQGYGNHLVPLEVLSWCYKCLHDGSVWQALKPPKLD